MHLWFVPTVAALHYIAPYLGLDTQIFSCCYGKFPLLQNTSEWPGRAGHKAIPIHIEAE